MKKSILALSLCAAVSLAHAADSNGLVTQPLTTQWGYAMFGVGSAGTFTGTKPTCATNPQTSHWVIEIKTATGRAMWASVLQAHALGKVLYVHGQGNCGWWGDRESVDYVVIAD